MAGKKFRVQLDFQEKDLERVDDSIDELGLSTRAELFRGGLRALFWMAEKRKQGCTVAAITPGGRCLEPEFDFLAKLPVPPAPEGVGNSK